HLPPARNPLLQNQLLLWLNFSEHNSHPRQVSSMSDSALPRKTCTLVHNPDSDPRPRRKWLRCAHTASKQAQIAGLFVHLRLGFDINHFNAGYKRIAACARTLRLHQGDPFKKWRWSCPRGERASYIKTETRSEEHTSELQSPCNLVCRLLLEKKKKKKK